MLPRLAKQKSCVHLFLVGVIVLTLTACEEPTPGSAAPGVPEPDVGSVAGAWPVADDIVAPEPAPVDLAGADPGDIVRYLLVREAWAPSLSPDGTQLAFRSDVTGEPELWVVDTQGGSPTQLTFGRGVTDHRWSPAGDQILYAADTDGDERPGFTLISPDGLTDKVIVDKSDAFRQFGAFSSDGSRFVFASTGRNADDFDGYIADVSTGEVRRVYEGNLGYFPVSWQPGGDLIIVSEARGEDANDLYLIDIAKGELEPLRLPEIASAYGGYRWLPDGAGFFMTTDQDREFAALVYVDIATRESTIVEDSDYGIESVALSGDGWFLAWLVNADGYSELNVLDRRDGMRVDVPVLPAGAYTLDFAAAAPVLAIAIQGPQTPGDIWTWDLVSGDVQRVTHSSMAGLDPERFIVPTVERFPARDGVQLQGLLYLPSTTQAAGRPPVLLDLHGGPTFQARPLFSALHQYLLGRGIAIFVPNYRGSLGLGKRFARLDDQQLRVNAVGDVADAIDWLGGDARVDGARIAIMGTSYGGYLVNAAIGSYPNKMAAAISYRGISDWVNALIDTSPSLRATDRLEYGDINDPAVVEFHREISPLRHFDSIVAPLLVAHAENDPRVPIAESDLLVRTVRENGGTVEYLRFTDEGHGIRKLDNRIYAGRRVAAFLERELFDD